MASELEHVHPTRSWEKVMSLLVSAGVRSGAEERLKAGMLRVARPTYGRSLAMVPSRAELPYLLNVRNLLGTAVEVGVDEGIFSEYLLARWHGEKLISVDPWLEMTPDEYVDTCNTSQTSMEQKYAATRALLAQFGARSEVWRETSVEAARRIERASLDFVYLDARHSFEGVSEDLEAWYPLLRRGGLMAGHDYNDGEFVEGIHGVRSAVDGFFGARGIRVRHTHTDVPCLSWLVQVP